MGLIFFPLIGLGPFAIRAGLGTAPAMLSLGMLLTYSVVLGTVYFALDAWNPTFSLGANPPVAFWHFSDMPRPDDVRSPGQSRHPAARPRLPFLTHQRHGSIPAYRHVTQVRVAIQA